MWSAPHRPSAWPKIASFRPVEVLDEYDGPRLFTLLSTDDHLLLAYQCGQDEHADRFLVVPADNYFIERIKDNTISLREALLGRSWAWIVDRNRDGALSPLTAIFPNELPSDALPRSGVKLNPEPKVLLRVRIIGDNLNPHNVPASVVRKALDGSTGAIRTLGRHAKKMLTATGRPTDELRSFYDLPAVEFKFASFEIAFGYPQRDAELPLAEINTLQQVQELLTKALDWAKAPTELPLPDTEESSVMVAALAKLMPPPRGQIRSVEIGGALAGTSGARVELTRKETERIHNARRQLRPDITQRTLAGYVREFDKDKFTFYLRNTEGVSLRHVRCTPEQYEDAYYAFDSNIFVTIVIEDVLPTAELVSLTPTDPPA